MDLNFDLLKEKALIYLPTVALAVIFLIVGLFIIKNVVRIAMRTMDRQKMDISLQKFLGSILSIFLKIMLVLSVISMFGIETTSFVAIFGALMIGVGMALNGTIGHFASGVMLMIFKPFKAGDVVIIGGGQTRGKVEEINAFNTILRQLDNRKIIIANSNVTGNDITNISGQGIVGVELTFGIGYDDNIDDARRIIMQVSESCTQIIKDPPQGVSVGELADSSVNLVTRPFCKSEHYWDVYFYLQENVKKEFDKAGIGIPYPQMDVHMRQVN